MEVESIKVTFVFLFFCPAVLIYIFTFKCSWRERKRLIQSAQRLQSVNSFHMSNQVSSILYILLLSFWGNWLWGSCFLIYARLSHVRTGPIDCDGATHLRKDYSQLVRICRVSPTFLARCKFSERKTEHFLHKRKPACLTIRSTHKMTLLKANSSLSSLGNILFTIQGGCTLTDKISY